MKPNYHFFGTSHTYGGGFEFHIKPKVRTCYGNFGIEHNENSFSYSGFLDRLLPEVEIHNHAKCGYGNERIQRKIFDVIEKNFNKETDILFIEFSDVGRKELWDNHLNDYVILNYSFESEKVFNCGNTYWYDSKETSNYIWGGKPFYDEFIKKTMHVDEQLLAVQRNFIMLVNFLQHNNIKFYLTTSAPITKFDYDKYYNIKEHLIEYEIPNKNGKIVKGNNFIEMSEPHFHIMEETGGYYTDFHQGMFINKLVSKFIFNRLIDDGIINKEKQIIDYSEWDSIKEHIKNNISIL